MDLIRGEPEHNFYVLAELASLAGSDDAPFVLFNVSDIDVKNGKGGNVHSCAAAQAAKGYWGKGCTPSVKEDANGHSCLEVSDRKARVRYHAQLEIIPKRGFDPERFDKEVQEGLHSRGGSLLISAVTCDMMPIDKYPPNENSRKRKRTNIAPRKPRVWKQAELKS